MMDLVSCQQKIILRWLMSRYLVWICRNQLHGMRPLLIWYALSRDTYVVQFGYVNLRLFAFVVWPDEIKKAASEKVMCPV